MSTSYVHIFIGIFFDVRSLTLLDVQGRLTKQSELSGSVFLLGLSDSFLLSLVYIF